MAWLYLPDMEGLSSESTPPSEAVEPWVTLSGKATQRPLSWRGWQNRPYIQLLSGTTLPPSTAARGAESWISSLRASRVSRSAWPEPDEVKATSDGSGTILSESFARFDLNGSLVKTSLDLFLLDSTPYCDPLPASGMMSAGELFELTRWEPPIDESESSSSPIWPKTPAASDGEGGIFRIGEKGNAKLKLRDYGAAWPNWPTATANDAKGSAYAYIGGDKTKQTPKLPGAAQNWPTPMAADDGHKVTANSNQAGLIGATHNWATANASDGKAGEKSTQGRTLLGEAETSSPPALQISICGPDCSPNHRMLNPAFVEWLMGLPSGWTIAKIGSGPVATELYHYKQQLQLECSRIARAGR